MSSPDLDALKRAHDVARLLALAEQEGLRTRSGRLQCPSRCSDDPRGATASDTPDGALWHCQRCGKGGSALDLLMLARGIDLQAATAVLSDAPPPEPIAKPRPTPINGVEAWGKLAASDPASLDYLRSRGLEAAAGECRFATGRTGIPWLDERAARGHRVAMPLRDLHGNVASFQLRSVARQVNPKFAKLSLPGPARTDVAFGHPERLSGAVANNSQVFVGEGIADTLALSIGAPGPVIGAPGTDLLHHLAPLIPERSHVVLAVQNDPPAPPPQPGQPPRRGEQSQAAFARLARELRKRGCRISKLATPSPHKDPAAWLQAAGLEAFRSALLNGAVVDYEIPGEPPAGAAEVRGPEPTGEPPPADAPHFVTLRAAGRYALTVEAVEAPEFRRMVCNGAALEYNTMAGRVELGREPLEDHRVNRARQLVPRYFSAVKKKDGEFITVPFEPNKDDFWAAVDQVAHESPYHPVQEYLHGLEWDRVGRLDMVARDILGIQSPTAIVRTMVRKFFIGAVARAMKPGCKLDTSLVLQGPQGAKKTSFFVRLCPREEWYLAFQGDYESRDAQQLLSAAWIVELAELESLRGREITNFKAFSTRQVDHWVGKWQRAGTSVPRTFVIVGTTNDETFLDDPSGNRRFWPVATGKIRLDLVDAWRDHLWAEARAAFENGEAWHLDAEGEADLQKAQEQFEVRDAWEPRILDWLSRVERGDAEGPVTVSAILESALLKQPGLWTKGDAQRVSGVLRRLGWRHQRRTSEGRRIWEWAPRKGWTQAEAGHGVGL